jgi:hypothetical protein
MPFDYNLPAEVFMQSHKCGRPIGYRRFRTAAEAIRFAIEDDTPWTLCLDERRR